MNFWIPYLLGFLACAASLGAFLLEYCFRLTAERDNWMKQAHTIARVLAAKCDEPTEIVWRDGIPVLMPIEPVEWPTELEVN